MKEFLMPQIEINRFSEESVLTASAPTNEIGDYAGDDVSMKTVRYQDIINGNDLFN